MQREMEFFKGQTPPIRHPPSSDNLSVRRGRPSMGPEVTLVSPSGRVG